MADTAPEELLDPLLLRHVAAQVDSHVADVVGHRGLTLDQWRMLETLAAKGEGTMAQLASRLGLSSPTATRIADRLVTTALVYRSVDPVDRRRVMLRAARRGRDLYHDLAPLVHEAQAQALGRLGDDERQTLGRLLRRALDNPHGGTGD
ncbi:MAG: MarR family transcriptional regulator [Nocardiopsaceae bacterium]|nr:MarR family transcriptional regulator [Nocardiopsaceae bacterium]